MARGTYWGQEDGATTVLSTIDGILKEDYVLQNITDTVNMLITRLGASRETPQSVAIVEVLERQVRVPAARDDLLGPIQVLAPTAQRPVRRRRVGHVAHVADLVRELELFRSGRELRRALDLQALTFLFVQTLVVGHLLDESPHLGAELTLQFRGRRPGVLDRVVENRRLEHVDVVDATDGDQHLGHLDRVVDEG